MRYQAALRPDSTNLGVPPEQSQDILQLGSDLIENFLALGLRHARACELPARAGYRVAALVEKFFDPQDHFDVLPFIYAMAGFRFLWRRVRELGLAEPEDERLNFDDLANLANAEEKFVGDFSHKTRKSIATNRHKRHKRKFTLGILCLFVPIPSVLRGSLHALLNYNGGPGEWKSLADPVFDEAFEREVQFPHLI